MTTEIEMDYRKTLNLPQTRFKMKANLSQKEPQYLKRWQKEDLYGQLKNHGKDKPLFVLHDGPPYANGNIHLGTAFNKILKDIILKSKRLAGFNAPYIPGWDCHGLPIEHNVDIELGEKKNKIPILSKRAACRKYATKWIKTQKNQFKRLGVLGDWDAPYLTMNYGYEAVIAKEFNRFLLSDSVVRHKKPVYWCSTCTTALAEAEVEYHDHTSPSIYVKFPVVDDLSEVDPSLGCDKLSVIIWTTTPWTLPANLAVAFHPDFVYQTVKVGDETWIMAKDLVTSVMEDIGEEDYTVTASFSARSLENKKCRHPFLNRDSLIVLANYVTTESGTGCVHTAPGHGADDYQTGLNYGLDILSPVDSEGNFTSEAGPYEGQHIPEVNDLICSDMDQSGVLIHKDDLDHSYPHCWRCKKPVMYRATPQWFISMDNNNLRKGALAAIDQVKWIPAWGMKRIYSMVESRPDWCLSRQRSWGVPITVISCKSCGEIVRDESVVEKIDDIFTKEGADGWFIHDVESFIGTGCKCVKCGDTEFEKEEDILDVWFDSGVSYAAVCEERDELNTPADLYLEGSDQHRGWFQSALLTSVGTRGLAPFKNVLTHGYVVDGQGKKMSKSVGNVVAPQEVIEKYGAEILRLWVASEDYRDDVKVSDEILRQVSDAYRKIRNTIRYMLGNLSDYDPNLNRVEQNDMEELDLWALARFEELKMKVVSGYERYEFHSIYHGLNYFCGTTMSAFYLDILKDRLYTSGTDSISRRSAQTVLYTILDGMLRLMSPILTFTAIETWEHLHKLGPDAPLSESVFFTEFAKQERLEINEEIEENWQKLIDIRSEITKALEIARREKVIGHPLEAKILLQAHEMEMEFCRNQWQTLKEISIVSEIGEKEPDSEADVTYASEEIDGLIVSVMPAQGEKCERCWTRSATVGGNSEHPTICDRCSTVVAEIIMD